MGLNKRLISPAAAASSDVDPLNDSSGLALYKLDGNSNDDGGNYNGTWSGTTRYTTGQLGQAAEFVGSTADYISLPTNFGYANNSFSISFWLANTKTSGNGYAISSIGTNTSCHGNLHLGRKDTGKFLFAWFCNDLQSSTNITTNGTWQHWTCTYNASTNTRKIYLNSIQDANDTPGSDYIGTENIQIGGSTYWFGQNNAYQGYIDQVRFFNKELTSSEVSTIYLLDQ